MTLFIYDTDYLLFNLLYNALHECIYTSLEKHTLLFDLIMNNQENHEHSILEDWKRAVHFNNDEEWIFRPENRKYK